MPIGARFVEHRFQRNALCETGPLQSGKLTEGRQQIQGLDHRVRLFARSVHVGVEDDER